MCGFIGMREQTRLAVTPDTVIIGLLSITAERRSYLDESCSMGVDRFDRFGVRDRHFIWSNPEDGAIFAVRSSDIFM